MTDVLADPIVSRALHILNKEDAHQMENRPLKSVIPLIAAGYARVRHRYRIGAEWSEVISITEKGMEAAATLPLKTRRDGRRK